MPNDNLFPRGSEWRKWDLHVHTPKSIVQSYGGDKKEIWDAFIKKLASLPNEIKVIGITDYLFCDGYEHLLTRRSEFTNIELIIPNIEFRLNTFSGTGNNTRRHNFHILFDPSVEPRIIREQLLNGLHNGYKLQDKTEWHQTPTVRSLEELGKEIKSAAPPDNSIQAKTDLTVGFNNITYKREDIIKLLEKSCFRGKFVTAIGYSEWDQSRWDQSAAEKRDLINVADFCLTSLSDPSKISANRDDLANNKLNSLVLHSSDAHDLSQIGQSLLWLKADPTFSGLKQIINEPDARVFIGTEPPIYKPDHKVITQISIPRSKGWFADDFSLELNRDLVSIIGGRGSGKSALAEAIAYGAGSKDDNENAFLKKAVKHKDPITGTEIHLQWGDGSKTGKVVGDLEGDEGVVQYLPQGVVEELCSHVNSGKLRKQIENVIFQALDVTEKMGVSSFDELKGQILRDFQYEKEQVVKNIVDINSRIHSLTNVSKGLPEKEKQLKEKKDEREKLNSSMPKLPKEDRQGQEELSEYLQSRKVFEDKIIELKTILSGISEIEIKVKVFGGKIREYDSEMNSLLSSARISESEVFRVNLDEVGIKKALKKKRDEISGQISILNDGDKADVETLLCVPLRSLKFDNLKKLDLGIDEKQKETRAFETNKIKYQQQKKAVFNLEQSIQVLKAEIERIKKETDPETKQLLQERLQVYSSYFELLKMEKDKVTELYSPLQRTLLSGTDTDKQLVFEAKIDHRLNAQVAGGLDIIDRKRRGNFRESNSIKTCFGKMADVVLMANCESEVVISELGKVLDRFMESEAEDILIEEQLRGNKSLEDFDNWLFDPSYYEVVSSLQFDGTDLSLLSPGQKGIVLLMLYLAIDKEDYRPLIIDQPEENLDNLSVYKDLIGYFRDRKQYRQIIIVTHNPNLVVNTDSEQIIVANYNGSRKPRLKYCSGSLEDQAKAIPDVQVEDLDDGIIDQVCSILEGGDIAFNKRKNKYSISCKIRG